MLWRLSKLVKYSRLFGFYQGLRLWAKIELSSNKRNGSLVRALDVPGYNSPVYFRNTIPDKATFWQCIVMEQYDFFAFPQSRRLLSDYRNLVNSGENPLIIDCGGNIGLATLWFAKKFPEAQIFIIEPDAENFALLQKNISFLGERVTALQGGIWNASSNLKIVNPESGTAAFRVAETTPTDNNGIRAYTIDEICEIANVDSPFIVKLDIEGGQAKLFSSNTKWVANSNLVCLELDDWLFPWKGTSQNFFSTMSQYPFDYLMRDESIFCFRNFEGSL